MSDVILVGILLAAFGLAIGLVRILDRLVAKDAPVEDLDAEPPDNGAATSAIHPGGSR
jgi:hypothetical protein